jgi:hypothetical protein
MHHTQPTLPSTAHLCLCNHAKQADENRRLLAYRATPKLIDRVIGPRFAMANACPSHKTYEAPVVLPRASAAHALGKRAARPRRLDQDTAQRQFAELVSAEAQLVGYDRSSVYNYRGRMPGHDATNPGPRVGTDGRVPIRGMAEYYAPGPSDPRYPSERCTKAFRCDPVGPATAEQVPTVPTRVPEPPVYGPTPQSCTNCTPRFDVFRDCERDCPRGPGSAQMRTAQMRPPVTCNGAPSPCPEPPSYTSAAEWQHWKGTMPDARAECWQWGDHPYELETYGVARKGACRPETCCQDLFANSTRRKLGGGG